MTAGGPVTGLLGNVEDQRLLAEQEVGTRALAVSEQRRVEVHGEELQVRVGLSARVGLGRLASLANAASAAARAHVGGRATDGQRDADSVLAARVRGARVELLARNAGKASRALASELEEGQVDALGVVHARVARAAQRSLDVQVAALRVRVVDQVLGAVHDGELAEAVADDELEVVTWVRDQIAGLGVHAQRLDGATEGGRSDWQDLGLGLLELLLLLLLGSLGRDLELWLLLLLLG